MIYYKPFQLNGITYQPADDKVNLWLEADDHTLIFERGYEELKHLGIMECRYAVKGLEDESDYGYDEDQVEDWISENVEDWCNDNINLARTQYE